MPETMWVRLRIQPHVDEKAKSVPAALQVVEDLHKLVILKIPRQSLQLDRDRIPDHEVRV